MRKYLRLFIGILFLIASYYAFKYYFDKKALLHKRLEDYKKLEKYGVKTQATLHQVHEGNNIIIKDVSPSNHYKINYFFTVQGIEYNKKYTGIYPFTPLEGMTLLVDIYYLPENPNINAEKPTAEIAILENEINFNRFLYLGILVLLFVSAIVEYVVTYLIKK